MINQIESKLTDVVNHYKEKKLSLGQCVLLAEMSEEDFIKYLAAKGVSMFNFETENEILEDIRNVKENYYGRCRKNIRIGFPSYIS